MGKKDFLPKVLNDLGVEQRSPIKFAQRPGQTILVRQETRWSYCVCLPRKPGEYILCVCIVTFCPGLASALGEKVKPKLLELGTDVVFKPSLTYFLPVSVDALEHRSVAIPQFGNGSGDLANLVKVDGFLELPADRDSFTQGERFPFLAI